MRKYLLVMVTIMSLFIITGCGNKSAIEFKKE